MLQWIQLKHLHLQLLMKKQRHWLKKLLSLLRLLHMLKVVTVVMVKNGVAPGGGSGHSITKGSLSKGKAAVSKGGKGKGKGKPSNKGKGKDKGNVGVASTASPHVGRGGEQGSPQRQRRHQGVHQQSPSPQRDAAQRSPIKRQWTLTPSWWNKSPVADRAQGKGGSGGSGGSGNNRKGRGW